MTGLGAETQPPVNIRCGADPGGTAAPALVSMTTAASVRTQLSPRCLLSGFAGVNAAPAACARGGRESETHCCPLLSQCARPVHVGMGTRVRVRKTNVLSSGRLSPSSTSTLARPAAGHALPTPNPASVTFTLSELTPARHLQRVLFFFP